MGEKKFVIVIPSYRNAKWAEKNIMSAVGQKYSNFKIIYTDDASPDGTADIIENLINKYKLNNVTLIRNAERKGALHNLYDMIWSLEISSIVVTVDGDDWLAHSNVLNRLNKEYQDINCWMSWGQYLDSEHMTPGCSLPFEQHIIDTNSYRKVSWRCSHLRTFYAGLFQKIKKEDLMHNGRYLNSAWDCAFNFPQLEMCAGKFKYIDEPLYIYNNSNPISDFRIHQQEQASFDRLIRNKKPYQRLDKLF